MYMIYHRAIMAREMVSPWIKEMDDRQIGGPVLGPSSTDIVVIGGGIAGISTAYYLLRETELRVVLIERDRIGHGASGRNGGQGIASVERSFRDLMGSLDGPSIASMLNDIETGHGLIDDICQETGYHDGLFKTTVWTGLSSMTEVHSHIEDMRLRSIFGAPVRPLFVDEGIMDSVRRYPELKGLITTETPTQLREILHTRERYVAAYPAPVSLANSGRLSRHIARYLLTMHPDRFSLHELSPVSRIYLSKGVKVHALGTVTYADWAVLCTNGYSLPEIISDRTPEIVGSLRRYVASMVGHRSYDGHPPGAFIYYHEEGDPEEEPYFYLTRRPYFPDGRNLVTVGGPQEQIFGDLDHNTEYPQGIYDRIDGFLSRSYIETLASEDMMCWNGPMGYTKDGVRLVGPDPYVKGLWYNTACNGVGFLPSIVGGKKVAVSLREASGGDLG